MSLLLALLLLLQGIPAQQGGTVTGILRDRTGLPLAGVRVAAVAKAGTPEEAIAGEAMAGLAETDDQGRFTLEQIPPGRYMIAAGRLDGQTYYPGTQKPEDATVFTIAAGIVIPEINFVLNDNSYGRSTFILGGMPLPAVADIPLTVIAENGSKIPLSANGKLVTVRLESATTGPVTSPVDSNSLSLPGPTIGDLRVSVSNLPEPYVVKSVTYGNTDVTRGTFRLIPANFSIDPARPPALNVLIVGAPAIPPVPTPTIPPLNLTITIGHTGTTPPTGVVRVSGQTMNAARRLVYISGNPGVFFTDGTFEFGGVMPGRHLITALGSPYEPMAAVVIVRGQSVEGVELKKTPMIPAGAEQEQNALPAGAYTPGSTIPLARVTGTILEETSRKPLSEGEVTIRNGEASRAYRIDAQGHFEALYLLPGRYDLKLQAFGHSTIGTEIVVEEKDMTLELTPKRLY